LWSADHSLRNAAVDILSLSSRKSDLLHVRERRKTHTGFLVGNPKERVKWEDLGFVGIKLDLEEFAGS